MPLKKMQLIGLVVIAAVATTTIVTLAVVDPFTPRYTLTIDNPSSSNIPNMSNVTVDPGNILAYNSPSTFVFKANTVVTLTIHVNILYMEFYNWTGPDASAVQVVTLYQIYTITMTKDMSIMAQWVC